MDIFLQRVTPPQNEPQAGASGGIPEEGVIIGDMLMQTVARDVEAEASDTADPDPVSARANVCVCVLVFNKKFRN